jgi:hypothetical protein
VATSGWFPDNALRAFPFLRGTVNAPVTGPLTVRNLPDDVIVDVGFVAGPESGYDSSVDTVYLSGVTRTGGVIVFEFQSTAPALFGIPLTFVRDLSEPGYVTLFSDTGHAGVSESSLSASDPACREPLWSGYLATGKAEALDLFLSSDGGVSGTTADGVVEPALVQNLSVGLVVKLALANDDRTLVTAADGCDTSGDVDAGTTHVTDRCVTGAVVLQAGYNATVRANAKANSLTLGAAVGAGAGQPCGEVQRYPHERPPAGSNLLGGGPGCHDVLRSINGADGPLFTITAGAGVTVTPNPETNSVTIDIDMTGLFTCFSLSRVSESC